MSEFFSQSRTTDPTAQILSSEFAKISMGGIVTLAQNLSMTYGRPLRPITTIGESAVLYVTGPAQGNVQLGRLTGKGGFLEPFRRIGANCGKITSIQVNASGGECAAGVGSSGISFGGGMLENVSLNIQTGTPEIVEGAQIKFSTLEV